MSESTGSVRIVDDGELAEVRALAESLGAEVDPDAASGESAAVLVTTPRYALAAQQEAHVLRGAATHIVIADNPTRTVRAQLQRSRCDFIVDRGAHPSVLRLLLLHGLYRGPERRRTKRVAPSTPIKLRTGRRTRTATLLQLSARGCGVHCNGLPRDPGRAIVMLPAALTGNASLQLSARVVGRKDDDDGGEIVSLVFSGVKEAERRGLRDALVRISRESGALSPGGAPIPGASRPPPDARSSGVSPVAPLTRAEELAASGEPAGDRRRSKRFHYARRVLASGDGRAQPLLGRDLSVGGMRIGPTPGLDVGSELKLALYGPKGHEPVLVRARVLRDYGSRGLGLGFLEIGADTLERLEKLVHALPVLGAPVEGHGEAGERPHMVVSEILEREDGGKGSAPDGT